MLVLPHIVLVLVCYEWNKISSSAVNVLNMPLHAVSSWGYILQFVQAQLWFFRHDIKGLDKVRELFLWHGQLHSSRCPNSCGEKTYSISGDAKWSITIRPLTASWRCFPLFFSFLFYIFDVKVITILVVSKVLHR